MNADNQPGASQNNIALNTALQALRKSSYPDERVAPFDVRLEEGPGKPVLIGRVLFPEQRQAAFDLLRSQGGEEASVQDEVQVLLEAEAGWGVVQRGVDDLRRSPSNQAERVSQVLFGERVRILVRGAPGTVEENWLLVRMEHDGYLGWTHAGAIWPTSAPTLSAAEEENAVVIADFLPFTQLGSPTRAGRGAPPGHTAGLLPFGVRLLVTSWEEDWVTFHMPDGSACSADRHGVLPVDQLPGRTQHGIQRVLDLLRQFVGVPYLWGGRSPFGYDCSGLAQIFYSLLKVKIPRDADQQFQACQPVYGIPQPGDLLFFGDPPTADPGSVPDMRYARITHVAISLGGDEMIHSNGSDWGISYNSLNPADGNYRVDLREHLAGAGRFG